MCEQGGFQLKRCTSNSTEVLQSISEEHWSKNVHELELDRDDLQLERALGLQWCVETDMFMFKLAVKEQPHSRRGLLSIVSSVYDPLGFLEPLILGKNDVARPMSYEIDHWDVPVPQAM